jgi:uncharacterized protein YecE (DUF72 family)
LSDASKPLSEQTIRVGPAGWSYKDWEGIVYPQKPGPKFDPLGYLSGFFDTIEINSTFYRPPSPSSATDWVRRVQHNVQFKFTAKLYRAFTHESSGAIPQDESDYRKGLDPIFQAGRLGAVLIQFPWSFKNTETGRERLDRLLKQFSEYPLVVEVRHASWNRPEVLDWFEEAGVGFCNIDQPLFRHSIKPSSVATSMVGYIRLHGRNYRSWFTENRKPSDRYDYLYPLEELEPWVDRVRLVSREVKETFVVTNNHYLGKGIVNALDIKALLVGGKVRGPAILGEKYPHLKQLMTA